jgi:glucose/arabinose dehydrogenase
MATLDGPVKRGCRPLAVLAGRLVLVLLLHSCGSFSSDTPPTSPPATVHALAGFQITPFLTGLDHPTALAYGPDGRLAIVQRTGSVLVSDGGAPQPYVSGLIKPLGVLWSDQGLYVVQQGSVRRFQDQDGDGIAEVITDLMTDLPDDVEAATIVADPDGWLYVGVGTRSDHTPPADALTGQIRRMRPDGTGEAVYATGLRMPFGLAFGPDGQLYATDNGREDLGEDQPPDELNRIEAGADYGWPGCWGDEIVDPDGGGTAAGCAATKAPLLALPAHSGVAGIVVATGPAVPPAMEGDLFIALSGSWYTAVPRGHSVLRVHGLDGPLEMSTIAEGFSRPVALAVSPEGRVLVADYDRGIIYHVQPE